MYTPLLSTKFIIPPVSQNLIPRPRLLEKLNGGLEEDRLLTLVSAPAGYGKTTLVSHWLDRLPNDPALPTQTAWLTLDQGEDDLARFLAYLVAALRQFEPQLGKAMLAALQTPRPPAPRDLATWLINDLVEIHHRFVLVLDDYHTIAVQSIHDFVIFLIDHQPPQMCLVVVTRADPSMPLARLRARGQLVEIRQVDLCFTLEETAGFIHNVMGINLTAEQLALLESRIEGWVAGLQLAALSMRGTQDLPSFIETFSGGHEFIADYLTDEVLSQQPEYLMDFLLQTSVLERLTAPLCEAITGQFQTQEILEKLKEANLFLLPLDHRQEWYRYHVLFADLLRKRLDQTQPERVNELHRRASTWYQANGLLAPAVEHALAGHDDERAADLVSQVGEAVLKRSEVMTLLRWLEKLPVDQQRAHPILLVYHGLALLMGGKPPGAVKSQLAELVASGDTLNVQDEYATFQALLAVMQGEAVQAIQLSEQALSHLALESTFFRTLAVDTLGMAYTLLGNTTAAAQAFEQAAAIAEQSDNVMMSLAALSNLAGLQVLQGKLHTAAKSYQRVIDLATAKLGMKNPAVGKALFGLGSLNREWNDLEGALKYYEEAAEMFKKSVEIGQSLAILGIVNIKICQKDWEGAQNGIEHARLIARSTASTPLDDLLVEETQARLWILQGKLEDAMTWVKASGILTLPAPETLTAEDTQASAGILVRQMSYMTLTRIYLAKGQPEEALAILDPLLDLFYQKKHMRRVIEALTLKALALNQQGEAGSAVQVLDEALALAEPEGYLRTFLDEGEPMAMLLYQVAAHGGHPEYAGKLLAAFADEIDSRLVAVKNSRFSPHLVEPLSRRELEVLSLIAQGLSNQEIAWQLVISLSTVKGHLTHIYRKLNVNSRTQALATARSLGLLSPG